MFLPKHPFFNEKVYCISKEIPHSEKEYLSELVFLISLTVPNKKFITENLPLSWNSYNFIS